MSIRLLDRGIEGWTLSAEEAKFLDYVVKAYPSARGARRRISLSPLERWYTPRMWKRVRWHSRRDPNREARALFAAVQDAFEGEGFGPPVEVYAVLVRSLAACSGIALGYDHNQIIPWDRKHEHMILILLREFMRVIALSITHHAPEIRKVFERVGQLEELGNDAVLGEVWYGSFLVPDWYVQFVECGGHTHDPGRVGRLHPTTSL